MIDTRQEYGYVLCRTPTELWYHLQRSHSGNYKIQLEYIVKRKRTVGMVIFVLKDDKK